MIDETPSRFPDDTLAIKEIDLQSFPTEEKALLMNLVKHLYSLIEARFDVSNSPPKRTLNAHASSTPAGSVKNAPAQSETS